jgi:hypothetical protein
VGRRPARRAGGRGLRRKGRTCTLQL